MTTPAKADFFISYTASDIAWAKWVEHELNNLEYRVIVQFMDFSLGVNFVLAIDHALARASRLIILLSAAYMRSGFAAAEWSTIFRLDPTGERRLIVPLLIEDFDVTGLLGPRVHIPLYGISEAAARIRLRNGLLDPRANRTKPMFPPLK